MARRNQIQVKPKNAGARFVLKSDEVVDLIAETYVKNKIPAGSVIEKEISGARQVIRVKKYGEAYAPLKREEAESGELIGFLSSIGKPNRRKYNTRLAANRKRRANAGRRRNAAS